ncbi:MAG: SMC-Scp complex subunit ScpB [Terriglobales bacterium]
MTLKSKIEAIIYAAEEPVTLPQITDLLKDAAAHELTSRAMQQAADPAEPQAIGDAEVKSAIRAALEQLIADYAASDRGMEIREIAGGYRMATKPEHHDLVRVFAKSLKPPVRLSLQALETLAVIAYKQPVTAPEISEIRGVDSSGVLATLLDRKLITTAGRKAVIGRPILYKTTKEFLLRFGLKDISELPSMEEFEKLAQDSLGADLFTQTPPETSSQNPAAAANSADPQPDSAADAPSQE